jgi:hypothetical protein
LLVREATTRKAGIPEPVLKENERSVLMAGAGWPTLEKGLEPPGIVGSVVP